VLGTAGELHLERCLKDLRERFARCEIQVGEPIVPYREGIVDRPSVSGDVAVGPRGTTDVSVSGKGGTIKIRLRVRPMPVSVMDFLTSNSAAVKKLVAEQQQQRDVSDDNETLHTAGDTTTGRDMTSDELRSGLREAFAEVSSWNADDFVNHIIAFGPRRLGPNVLLDSTPNHQLAKSVFKAGHQHNISTSGSIGDKIIQAFQLATQQGPLCHEPTQGISVSIHSLSYEAPETHFDLPSLTPPLLKALRTAIHSAFHEYSPRIYLATVLCTISVPETHLGRVYDVLARCRAHILSEVLSERTNLYSISSLLALRESFGFADEIRKRTSGAASVEISFRGFENLEDEDPYWVPRTEEELEDLGDTADRENRARALVDEVRRRKGMLVAGKKGLDGEKERNLKR
jgi:ribosome assembly protein 1